MVIKTCPNCQRRFVTEDTEDIIHKCNSNNKVLDNEDVFIVGDWEDYTGSGTELNVNFQGSENELFGTRADVEGDDVEDTTRRGKRASTYRQRKHEEFISMKGGC